MAGPGVGAESAQFAIPPDDARVRAVRTVRDYAMFDRHEAAPVLPGCGRPRDHSGVTVETAPADGVHGKLHDAPANCRFSL